MIALPANHATPNPVPNRTNAVLRFCVGMTPVSICHLGFVISLDSCSFVSVCWEKMKTLGMIGGLGPESTLDYYQRIIALYRERAGDGHYPEFVIASVDLRKGLDFMDAKNLTGMGDFLVGAIGKVARAGAEFGIICANTPHIVFDQVALKSPIPLISIVEATCAAAKTQKLNRLALFGTRYTMQPDFYPRVFDREGIELHVPDSRHQE